jgi:translation initiation factor IF-3
MRVDRVRCVCGKCVEVTRIAVLRGDVRLSRAPVHAGGPAEALAESKEQRISDPRTNDRIRVPEVRLVGPAGEQVGVVSIDVALRLAQEADLDLVEVAPNSKPPVAKIMDYGKFKYEAAQKAKEARRNQANTILKEVRFRLKIDVHDYETKRKRAEGFLKAGDKVKAMILFRGREQSRPDQGVRLLQRFAEDVSEFGSVESSPTIDGRNMVMVIGPLKNSQRPKPRPMPSAQQRRHRGRRPQRRQPPRPHRPRCHPPRPHLQQPRPRQQSSYPATTGWFNRYTHEETTMPKMKTHSGAKKRFKITGSGKVMKQQAGMRHNLEVKSGQRKRRLNTDQVLAPQDAKVIKKLLGL